jgi:RNA polymerase sigma-54 factor
MLQQTQTQRQTLKYSPLQIQFLNLIQLTTLELEQHIRDEMEANPVLEEGADSETPAETEQEPADSSDPELADKEPLQEYFDLETLDNDDMPSYKTRDDNYAEDDHFSIPMVQGTTFQEDLKEQIRMLPLTERQTQLADFIIDSLSEDGFMDTDLEDLCDDISFSLNFFVEKAELQAVLRLIQQLDPPGVGAVNVQECLLIQLLRRKREGQDVELAYRMVKNYFNELSHKQYDKIVRLMGIEAAVIKKAIAQIATLNPKPVAGQKEENAGNFNIYPEFVLTYYEGVMEVVLNSRNAPELRINNSLRQMAEKANKSTQQFVRSKIQAAKWLIDAIKQRENTMLKTMQALAQMQHDFFATGDWKKLKPMILKDVADVIGMDISTVSRVTSTKYVQTSFGTIHLKDLFTEGLMSGSGQEVSNKEIQETIAEVVAGENKQAPFSDQQLAAVLKEKGYPIARRTVAKYREHMNISTAQLRREI